MDHNKIYPFDGTKKKIYMKRRRSYGDVRDFLTDPGWLRKVGAEFDKPYFADLVARIARDEERGASGAAV